jgi:hypothetical protein
LPTITIRTGPLPVVLRRAIAVKLTRWLTDAGATAAHVTVCFEEMTAGTVFSGGMPAEALAGPHAGPAAATVVCRVSPDRDGQFREELAREIVSTLPDGDAMPFVYVEFQPTAAGNVWIANHGQVWCADQPPAGREKVTPSAGRRK